MEELFKIEKLTKIFENVEAVSSVDLYIRKGETLGLGGESGSGKSTLARLLLGLIAPTCGKIIYKGSELNNRKSFRKAAQIVFQDPQNSLNPRMNINSILEEPMKIHGIETRGRVDQLLALVKLPVNYKYRFPHELSGGERQRIGIARALALGPEFIILDEPISALDVTIQVEIINLLQELKKELSLTYLFIAHDLMVLKKISDRIAIMQKGKIVEINSTCEIFNHPQNQYTKKLLSSILKIKL